MLENIRDATQLKTKINQKLSFDEAIKKAKSIAEMLDITVKMVDDLHVNYLLDSSDYSSRRFGDILIKHWQPILDLISNFQLNWNNTITEVMQDKYNNESKQQEPTDNLWPEKDVELISDDDSYHSSHLEDMDSLPPPTSDSEIEPPNFEDDSSPAPSEGINTEEVLDILNNVKQGLDDQLSDNFPSIPVTQDSAELVKVNKMLFDNFLKSEKVYHSILYSLNMYYNALCSYAGNDQNSPMAVEAPKIFGKVHEIIKFHGSWLDLLESKQGGSEEINHLCEFILSLRQNFPRYKAHSDDYATSIELLRKLWSQKGSISETVPKMIGAGDMKITTEDALYRPVSRLLDYYTLIDELLKSMSYSSPFYETFSDIREELNLFSELIRFNSKDKKSSQRVLVKWTPIVEDCGGDNRKHRILVLLTDFLICAGENSKGSVVLKWHCSLKKLRMMEEMDELKQLGCAFEPVQKSVIDSIREDINGLKSEINKIDQKKNKKFDKLKRQLEDKMSELVLKFSSNPLFLFMADGKRVLLLFMTEDNRKAWERLLKVRKNSPFIDQKQIFMSEVNELLEGISHNLRNSLNSLLSYCLINKDSVQAPQQKANNSIRGRLFVKIKTMRNPDAKADPKFTIELDKHREVKSTKLSKSNVPVNEIITFDVDSFQGHVFIFTGKSPKNDPTSSLGLNLLTEGILKKPVIRRKKSYKWGEALFFFEFSSTSITADNIINFNVLNPSLDKIIESEGGEIPHIVEWSTRYIEEHGLTTVGIYRVSGTSSRAAMAKQMWMDGFITCYEDMQKMDDCSIVAGILKQFLRELKEPLIPFDIIQRILDFDYNNGSFSELNDILDEMPEINRKVLITILNHLLQVEANEDENKMNFENISTVFCVNILKTPDTENDNMMLGSSMMNVLLTKFSNLLKYWKRNSQK